MYKLSQTELRLDTDSGKQKSNYAQIQPNRTPTMHKFSETELRLCTSSAKQKSDYAQIQPNGIVKLQKEKEK